MLPAASGSAGVLVGTARQRVSAAHDSDVRMSAAPPDWSRLFRRARAVARHAYAPYSGYHVGAAGLVDDGRVVEGCNVENASYGLALCAECSLVSALHSTGGGRLLAVAVVAGRDVDDLRPGKPCGRCRQLLYEAGGPSLRVNERHTLGEMLPDAFGPDALR